MAPASDIDLFAPFERDIILEVRTSKMKSMPGLNIQTGIDKNLRHGRIPVSMLGLEEDEHDLTFHGGIDKAIHGYCSTHYAQWRKEFPEAAARFQPGGFGENFVTAHMNERNVCIGDIMSVGSGDGLLLQVSLPRQPCFKLNHRFQLKNFAPNTYRLSRTGWYYRVLRTGSVQAGDEIRLVERRWPQWTIERVQEFLHRTQNDAGANEALAQIPDMGDESRKQFERRVAKRKARLAGTPKTPKWRDYRVVEKKAQTPRVASFVLQALDPDDAETADLLGAHARLRLPNGLVRTYSIVGGTANRFELGVALEENSRGGSAYLHRAVEAGDVLQVGGRIAAGVAPAAAASYHVFIAGGIGITAFLPLIETGRRVNYEIALHWAVRSQDDVPFRERVEALARPEVKQQNGGEQQGKKASHSHAVVDLRLYDASQAQRMHIPAILAALPWNAHVYVCGPDRMMQQARREAQARGLGPDDVHYEAFAAADLGHDNDAPFEAVVGNRKGRLVKVDAEETLLEALRREFEDEDEGGDVVPSSCEVGNCGTCKVVLRAGRVEHRGTGLPDEEKGEAMLSCVSRGLGRIEVEV
ncbi:PK beta-barrel-protein domain-containing protein-like protein [Camillea tinctor]|nr:PK beta-barrel-protein domain-containing protein-like protein [Camillea tinctor]